MNSYPNISGFQATQEQYLNTYGMPVSSPYGAATPSIKTTETFTDYRGNFYYDCMELVKISSTRKVKISRLSSYFNINRVVENYNISGEIVFSTISYSTKTSTGLAVVPGCDYQNGKLEKYFDGIARLPGCSKSDLNLMLEFYVKSANHQKELLCPHQGFNADANGNIVFSGIFSISDCMAKYFPTSVKKRKVLTPIGNPIIPVSQWQATFNTSAELIFLSCLRISCLLLYVFKLSNFMPSVKVCIQPSENPNGLSKEKLTALFSTNDTNKYPPVQLDAGKRIIMQECSEVYDGPFLVVDNCFADEEDKVLDGAKSIVKCVDLNIGRNIPIVISANAGSYLSNNKPENLVFLDVGDVDTSVSAAEIEYLSDAMDFLVCNFVTHNFLTVKEFFSKEITKIQSIISNTFSGERLKLATMMFATESFLNQFFSIERRSQNNISFYTNIINNGIQDILDAPVQIIKEFGSILSQELRDNHLSIVRKVNNMTIPDSETTIVASGDRIMLSLKLVDDVSKRMHTVRNSRGVVSAFKKADLLFATDGDTHPFDSHDGNGKYQRLYFYDLPANILDSDVLYKVQNIETSAFMLSREEINILKFTPYIMDPTGNVAGRLFAYDEVENESIAIYGQCGEGKSFSIDQILANRFMQGYNTIAFESSGSFTYDALCKNLSKKFVDENVVFHRLHCGELRIDVYGTNKNAASVSKKNELLGIVAAGIGDLTASQTNFLRSQISEYLKVGASNNLKFSDYLSKKLNGKDATTSSLKKRLVPLFEDVAACNLTNGTWSDYLNGERKIHIIQIDSSFSVKGKQLFDILIAALYNYQAENFDTPLTVFIDEIQGQNLSVSSPILKILKEGRKIHLSLVTATQDFYARSTEIGKALGKADTQIHHRPTQDSTNLVAAELRWGKAEMSRFDMMNRGDAIIKGSLYNKERKRNTQATIYGRIYSVFGDNDKLSGSHETLKT